MASDPFYSSTQMPEGHTVSGGAAFMHRVKVAGGPSKLVERVILNTLAQTNALAAAEAQKGMVANSSDNAKQKKRI